MIEFYRADFTGMKGRTKIKSVRLGYYYDAAENAAPLMITDPIGMRTTFWGIPVSSAASTSLIIRPSTPSAGRERFTLTRPQTARFPGPLAMKEDNT